MTAVETIGAPAARRAVLAAQGFGGRTRPVRSPAATSARSWSACGSCSSIR